MTAVSGTLRYSTAIGATPCSSSARSEATVSRVRASSSSIHCRWAMIAALRVSTSGARTIGESRPVMTRVTDRHSRAARAVARLAAMDDIAHGMADMSRGCGCTM